MKKNKIRRTYLLSEKTVEDLEQIAEKEDRKLSAIIERAIEDYKNKAA